MKCVVITGSSGFIGKNFLRYIINSGLNEHYKFVLLTDNPDASFKNIVHKNYSFSKNDFLNAGIEKTDILIHMGAFTPKNNVQSQLSADNYSNVSNSMHLLKNLPSVPESILYCSTLDVYKPQNSIISEETQADPQSFYGWAKLFSERLIDSWAKENTVQYSIFRLGHVFGPGEQEYQKLIPLTIRTFANNAHFNIQGNGMSLRDYIYVEDICRYLAAWLNSEIKPELLNIVSGQSISIQEVVKCIHEHSYGKGSFSIGAPEAKTSPGYRFDAGKLHDIFGPCLYSFEEGIKSEINSIHQ